MIFSESIHTAANGNIYSFVWPSKIPLYICTTSETSHLLMSTWVASMSWLLQIVMLWTLGCMYLFELRVFIREYTWNVFNPGMGLLDHMVTLFLVFFKKPPDCFPQWLYQFSFPPTVNKHFLFSTSSPTPVICGLFNNGHSDRCEVISLCGFDLHFPED